MKCNNYYNVFNKSVDKSKRGYKSEYKRIIREYAYNSSSKKWRRITKCIKFRSWNISDICKKVKEKDKVAVIHIDLVEGLANKEVAIKFIKEFTDFDGIISTKPALIRIAKANGLIAIQRM